MRPHIITHHAHPVNIDVWAPFVLTCYSAANLRCPRRPSAEQEDMGAGCQGCPVQTPHPHQPTEKRRGGRQGEALQLRSGRQRQEPQGPGYRCR